MWPKVNEIFWVWSCSITTHNELCNYEFPPSVHLMMIRPLHDEDEKVGQCSASHQGSQENKVLSGAYLAANINTNIVLSNLKL